jgi:phosphoenolpyruvate carboxykinase (ATP)
MLGAKLDQYGTQVYLVNTGWAGGSASSGAKRMKLSYTRAMVTAALNGELANAETVHDDIFNLEVPTHITNVPDEVLIPKSYWKVCGKTEEEYYESANKLADMFENNFAKKYANMDEKIVAAGPHAKK